MNVFILFIFKLGYKNMYIYILLLIPNIAKYPRFIPKTDIRYEFFQTDIYIHYSRYLKPR